MSGVPQASAWKALFGITRCAFAEVPKMPSAHEARCSSSGSRSYSTHGTQSTFAGRPARRVELAATDNPQPQLGCESCRFEDRLQTVKRDQLADEAR